MKTDLPVALVGIAATSTAPPQARQLATVVLKRHVARHWSSLSDRDESEPPCAITGDAAKLVVREALVPLLAEPVQALRVAAVRLFLK